MSSGRAAKTNVLHRCDEPRCVRPAHLFTGTHADNVADKVAKGRQARGGRNGRARLKERDVATIRRALRGGALMKPMARQYGVSPRTISLIRDHKTWKHLET